MILILAILAGTITAQAQSPQTEMKKHVEKFRKKMEADMKSMEADAQKTPDPQDVPGNLVQEHKTLQNTTIVDEIAFHVNRKIRRLELSIVGHSTTGDVDIDLVTPKGNNLTTIHMENGNYASWSRVIPLPKNSPEFIGNWKFTIRTKGATGEYTLRANGK